MGYENMNGLLANRIGSILPCLLVCTACCSCSEPSNTPGAKTSEAEDGTLRQVNRAVPASEWQVSNFPESERFSLKRIDGQWVKHGTYVRSGPNGEETMRGEYSQGERVGNSVRIRAFILRSEPEQ